MRLLAFTFTIVFVWTGPKILSICTKGFFQFSLDATLSNNPEF